MDTEEKELHNTYQNILISASFPISLPMFPLPFVNVSLLYLMMLAFAQLDVELALLTSTDQLYPTEGSTVTSLLLQGNTFLWQPVDGVVEFPSACFRR